MRLHVAAGFRSLTYEVIRARIECRLGALLACHLHSEFGAKCADQQNPSRDGMPHENWMSRAPASEDGANTDGGFSVWTRCAHQKLGCGISQISPHFGAGLEGG
jgi:hypothetical protein